MLKCGLKCCKSGYADVSLPIPKLIPIRYEVQLQMPTSSDKDPLIRKDPDKGILFRINTYNMYFNF